MRFELPTTRRVKSICLCRKCEREQANLLVCVQTCRSVVEDGIEFMASRRRREIFTLVVVFAGVVVLGALGVYYLGGGRRATPETIMQEPRQPDAVLEGPTERASPASQAA